jgi:hypothetical protein
MGPPYVFSLTGWPGTGKYTVAKELVAQLGASGHETRLLDNHSTANPILGVVRIERDAPVPPEVWSRVRELRAVIFATITTLSPPEWSFVFTNFIADTPADREHYRRLAELAHARRSCFVPVLLTVERDELLRRMAQPERAARMKITNTDLARTTFLTRDLFVPDHEHTLALDVTHVQPGTAAAQIIEHALRLSPPD